MVTTVIVGNSPLFNISLKKIISELFCENVSFKEYPDVESVAFLDNEASFVIAYDVLRSQDYMRLNKKIRRQKSTIMLVFKETLGLQDRKNLMRSKVDFIIPMRAEIELVKETIKSLYETKEVKNKFIMSKNYLSLFRGDVVDLTKKEMNVMLKICEGYSNVEISSEMGVSTGAVKATITRARRKLRITSRHQTLNFYDDLVSNYP
ncbi:MAG: helix-turn-helix transcriptional regulator [Oceanospirillales bacterium]|nr:helix-turn-helix transcriptional regulator [Oceanospirillales bacterium]